jgi:hypothetical protein
MIDECEQENDKQEKFINKWEDKRTWFDFSELTLFDNRFNSVSWSTKDQIRREVITSFKLGNINTKQMLKNSYNLANFNELV